MWRGCGTCKYACKFGKLVACLWNSFVSLVFGRLPRRLGRRRTCNEILRMPRFSCNASTLWFFCLVMPLHKPEAGSSLQMRRHVINTMQDAARVPCSLCPFHVGSLSNFAGGRHYQTGHGTLWLKCNQRFNTLKRTKIERFRWQYGLQGRANKGRI